MNWSLRIWRILDNLINFIMKAEWALLELWSKSYGHFTIAYMGSDAFCACDMHVMIHKIKLKIDTNLSIHNYAIGLIIHLVSYNRKLHQEITSLRGFRMYSSSYWTQIGNEPILIRLSSKVKKFLMNHPREQSEVLKKVFPHL